MTRTTCRLVLLTLVLALMAGCQSGRPVESGTQGTRPVNILAQDRGDDPALPQAGAWLINSQSELEATGSEALRGLNVDFETHSLVVVALGQKPTGGYWVRITGAQAKDQSLFVQAVANRPAPNQPVTQMVTHPYAAAVVEKVSAAVVHPEVQSVEGQSLP